MTYIKFHKSIKHIFIILLGAIFLSFPSVLKADPPTLLSLKQSINIAKTNDTQFNKTKIELLKVNEELKEAKEKFISQASLYYKNSDLFKGILETVNANEIIQSELYQTEPFVTFYNTTLREFLIKENAFHTFEYTIEHKIKLAYYSLSKQQELIQIQQDTINELNSHYESIKKFYDKGILSKVELMQVETILAESKENLQEMNLEFEVQKTTFNKLLNQDLKTSVSVEPLLKVIHEYTNFNQWISINLSNYQIKTSTDSNQLILTEDTEYRLRKLYPRISDKKKQIKDVEEIINKNEKILEFQKKRFKNTRSTSGDVIDAILHLNHIRQKRLQLLYEYHVTTAESENLFLTKI